MGGHRRKERWRAGKFRDAERKEKEVRVRENGGRVG